MRYGKALERITINEVPKGFYLVKIVDIPTEEMVTFFDRQPEEAYTFFHPHEFDAKNVRRLQKNKSFLAYVLKDKTNDQIVGYCFNRSFFHGKAFRGRMVDIDYRGKGLGTAMNKILNEVGFGIGLWLFETVSKENVASYRSALSASKVRVVKEMPGNELFLEIQP